MSLVVPDGTSLLGAIHQALAAAGFCAGSFQKVGRTYYEAPAAGYVIKMKYIEMPLFPTTEPYLPWNSARVYRYYVDHVGPGRKASLVDYGRALERAGAQVLFAPGKPYNKREVVWVDEYFLHGGKMFPPELKAAARAVFEDEYNRSLT